MLVIYTIYNTVLLVFLWINIEGTGRGAQDLFCSLSSPRGTFVVVVVDVDVIPARRKGKSIIRLFGRMRRRGLYLDFLHRSVVFSFRRERMDASRRRRRLFFFLSFSLVEKPK